MVFGSANTVYTVAQKFDGNKFAEWLSNFFLSKYYYLALVNMRPQSFACQSFVGASFVKVFPVKLLQYTVIWKP